MCTHDRPPSDDGLFRICATPEVAFQSALTCAAGIVGLPERALYLPEVPTAAKSGRFRICAAPEPASQSAFTGRRVTSTSYSPFTRDRHHANSPGCSTTLGAAAGPPVQRK